MAELDELLQSGFRYAFSLTHDRGEAEDLLQEACASILRVEGPWTKGYLFSSIRNRFIDAYRRDQRLTLLTLESIELEIEEADEHPFADSVRSGVLQQALATLRPEEREVLFLMFVEGYTASEIAELTGRPRGTVLSLAHRARQKLREILIASRWRSSDSHQSSLRVSRAAI